MEAIEKQAKTQEPVTAHHSAQASAQKRMLAIFFTGCCIAAPLLMGLASFDMGELKTYVSFGGVLNMYGLTIWIGEIVGMAWLLWPHAPRLALITASLGVIGCIGGSNFVLAAMFRRALMTAGVDQELLWLTSGNMSTAGALVSASMGLWFPLALILFGIGLMRFKVIRFRLGALLVAGGICFPLGRIPGNLLFVHAADALLFAATAVLGWSYMRTAQYV